MQSEAPPFITNERRRGRRAAGILYEEAVHEEFTKRYAGYLPSMWFNYADSRSDAKWCQTDGLIVDPWRGRIVIVEVKLQHTPVAYEQLFYIYLPVLRAVFGGIYELACCEVVKWFDVATLTARRPSLCADPARAKPSEFNVHIWRP
jgi:hypothetical protein